MNDQNFQPQHSAINLDAYSNEQIEKLINEGTKVLKKRKDDEVKKFQADIRKKAKEKGLKVSFEEMPTKPRAKSTVNN